MLAAMYHALLSISMFSIFILSSNPSFSLMGHEIWDQQVARTIDLYWINWNPIMQETDSQLYWILCSTQMEKHY